MTCKKDLYLEDLKLYISFRFSKLTNFTYVNFESYQNFCVNNPQLYFFRNAIPHGQFNYLLYLFIIVVKNSFNSSF